MPGAPRARTAPCWVHRNRPGAPLALLGAAFVLGNAASARRSESAVAVAAAHQAERTRIARELHDLVAHQLSAITVQAGAARMAARGPADPLIATVEQLSRAALAELNQLPGALRQEPDGSVPRSPAPILAGLDGLVAASRETGTAARPAVIGRARPLPPGWSCPATRGLRLRARPGRAGRLGLSIACRSARQAGAQGEHPADRGLEG